MTPVELARLRGICEAATPGPWAWQATNYDDNEWCVGTTDPPATGQVCTDDGTHVVVDWVAFSDNAENFADAAFIAEARTALPAALDEIERLRDALEWTLGVIEHDVKPPESCGACGTPNARCDGECADAYYFATHMRDASKALGRP